MILSHFFALFAHISSLSATVDSPNSVRNIRVGADTKGGGGGKYTEFWTRRELERAFV